MLKKLGAYALCTGMLATPALAQVPLGAGFSGSGSVTATTDYVTRGISQTRSRPALQGTAELSHESGIYVGAFISNVAFEGTDARQEVDGLLGYRFTLAGIRFDAGGAWYGYPGYSAQPGQYDLAFGELILRAAYDLDRVTLSGLVAWSPNYFFESGTGVRAEGSVAWTTPLWDIVLAGRVGYQWIERNNRIGLPDYFYYGVTVSKALGAGFTIGAGVFGTDISQSDCVVGQKICDTRALGWITWQF